MRTANVSAIKTATPSDFDLVDELRYWSAANDPETEVTSREDFASRYATAYADAVHDMEEFARKFNELMVAIRDPFGPGHDRLLADSWDWLNEMFDGGLEDARVAISDAGGTLIAQHIGIKTDHDARRRALALARVSKCFG